MAAAEAGAASVEFDRLLARVAVGLRLAGTAVGCLGAALGFAAPASLPVVASAAAGLVGWVACYAVVAARRGLAGWLVAVDNAVVAVVCLGYRWLVPVSALPGWSSWLAVLASSAVVASQLRPRRPAGIAATVAVPAAYAAGTALAGQPVPALCFLLGLQGIAASVFAFLLRRRVRALDTAMAELAELQRDAAVRAGQRAQEREHCRLLHDSVSATLTVVATGALGPSPVLRAQARRDLAVLDRIQAPAVAPGGGAGSDGGSAAGSAAPVPGQAVGPDRGDADRVDLRGCLAPVVAAHPELVVDVAVADITVPAAVAAGLAASVGELLRNVARHAGVGRAEIRARADPDAVWVEVADAGRGFDPAGVLAHRRGLRESVAARMAGIGGSAAVVSRPGAGTRVTLQWPDVSVEVAATVQHSGFVDLVTDRYQRALDVALVTICGVRHLANALILGAGYRWAYRWPWVEVAAWVVLAAVAVTGSFRLLRHPRGTALPWLLATAAVAAGVTATAGVAATAGLTAANWAAGGAGWFGVLLLVRRPIRELTAMIVLSSGLNYAVLFHDGVTDRGSLARFLMMSYAIAILQVAIAWMVRASDATAARGADAAERQAAVRSRALVAEVLHRGRGQRYEDMSRSVAPLLVGLATGDLDPADPRTQDRCALEASRLRRLFAEADDVPNPLLHELRACADIAHSRGVPVDLHVVGQLPALHRSVRRALIDVPSQLLADARHEARITVHGTPDRVTVSVFADTSDGAADPLPPPADAGSVTVTEWAVPAHEPPRRWVEATWHSAAPATAP